MMLFKKQKGLTLIEILVAMGISFLLIAIIYQSFSVSNTFFNSAQRYLYEKTCERVLFAGITDDLAYLSKINHVSGNGTEIQFEIFQQKILETNELNGNRTIQGARITISPTACVDFAGNKFVKIRKTEENYTWELIFGHSQSGATETGYPEDLPGSIQWGNSETTDVIEQEEKNEFLIKSLTFSPCYMDGRTGAQVKITNPEELPSARLLEITLTYRSRMDLGDKLHASFKDVTVTKMIPLSNKNADFDNAEKPMASR